MHYLVSCAVKTACSEDVIRFLMNRTPSDILSGFDRTGKRILHYIQDNLTNPDVIELLVKNNPDMLQSQDRDKKTPMHCAIERGLSLPVVERLIDKCPKSLAIPDKDGRLPVHFLSTTKYDEFPSYIEVQCMIIAENSSAEHLLAADNELCLPIHQAILCKAEKEIIEILIERCPGSLLHFDASDGQIPLHYALAVEYQSLYTEILRNDEGGQGRLRLQWSTAQGR